MSDRNIVPDRSIGLTKKEYIAAMAMQGLLASPYGNDPENCAKFAITYADALINELNKGQ